MQRNREIHEGERAGPGPRRGWAAGLIVPILAGALLTACEHRPASNVRSAPPAAQAAEASDALNKEWGSCRFRRCDLGR